jgi:signal transduction histidine kinase
MTSPQLHHSPEAPVRRTGEAVPSGISAVGSIPWGTHLCHFYRSAEDLADVLVPYFIAGLRNHEKCLWLASAPLDAAQARERLVQASPDAERCLQDGQLEIADDTWYARGERSTLDSTLRGWFERERQARQAGFRGLRLTGNTSWLQSEDWSAFCAYEAKVERAFHRRNIVALCSYPLPLRSSSDLVDVLRNHHVALVHRSGAIDALRTTTATLSALEHSHPSTRESMARCLPSPGPGPGPDGTAAIPSRADALFARLHAVSSTLLEASSLPDIARLVESDIRQAVRADHARLAIVEDGSMGLCIVSAHGDLDESRAAGAGSALQHAFQTDHPLFLPSQAAIAQTLPGHPTSFGALAAIPIATRGTVLGAMELGFRSPKALSPVEKGFLDDAARHVAVTVERVLLAEALRREDRRKDEFLAVLAHELRNPLAPILMALEIMRMHGIDAIEKPRRTIERQTIHLSRLVDDLLDVSRIRQGKVELRVEEVELAGVLARAIEIASPLIDERKHTLTVDGAATAGMLIWADPTRLSQAIANVLMNAAKYADPCGRIEVTCVRTEDMIDLRVRDSGIGIPEGMLRRIFEPFVQGPRSNGRAVGGLGLGLTLVKTLMEFHGGGVHVSSEGPGKGSTFTLRIPAIQTSA